MPHARITIGRPDLSPDLQQTLASTVTDLMATDLLKVREEAVVHLELVEPGHFFVDGVRQTGATGVLVEVFSTTGTVTTEEKAQFIADVHREFSRHLDPLAPIVYVLVSEIDGQTWGHNGRSQLARKRDQRLAVTTP